MELENATSSPPGLVTFGKLSVYWVISQCNFQYLCNVLSCVCLCMMTEAFSPHLPHNDTTVHLLKTYVFQGQIFAPHSPW